MNDTQLQPLNTSCDGASYLSICPHTYSFLSSLCSLDSWVHFSSVQSLSRVWLFATSRTAACQSLLKFMSIESVMLSKHLILSAPFSSCLQSFPASGSFPRNQSFISGGQSIGVSVSTSVLLMNIQDWSPLGWTGCISSQSKGLSRVSPTPQFKSINSSVLRFLYSQTHTSIHDYWKNHSLTTWPLLAN